VPLNQPLESITEADLRALVTDEVPEGKTIEYKRALPDNTHDDIREFLADLSSFANAAGGHLIFGVEEEAGVPVNLCGLQGIDPDAEILRLENRVRDCIEPRIPGVSMRTVPLQASRVVITIRIPRSWAQPHVVKYRRHWRFYSRNSAGKYPLDVSELRGLFLLSETTAERIRLFRAERLGRIVADETPVALDKGAKIVLHIIPFGAFDPAAKFDMASFGDDVWRYAPIYESTVTDYRYNLDGIVTSVQSHDSAFMRSYLQIFRNGIIEAVDTRALRNAGEGSPIISSGPYEKGLLDALPRYLAIQKRLGVEPPFFIMLSLLGVLGYFVKPGWDEAFWRDRARPIDRDALLLPEVMADGFECDPIEAMIPIFDMVWNASGWPRSMNYNEEGKPMGYNNKGRWVVQE